MSFTQKPFFYTNANAAYMLPKHLKRNPFVGYKISPQPDAKGNIIIICSACQPTDFGVICAPKYLEEVIKHLEEHISQPEYPDREYASWIS